MKTLTALGEACVDAFSDRGSTPLASTSKSHNRFYIDCVFIDGYFFNISPDDTLLCL